METKRRTSIQVTEELLGEAVLTHPLDAGWASTRCAKLHARLSGAWEREVITFLPPLPPVQTVLNEKDKFRVSTALCTFTYGLSKENDTPC